MTTPLLAVAAASALLLCAAPISAAQAETNNAYVMGAFGGTFTWETGNTARLTEEFITGNGILVPSDVVFPPQTVAEFTTQFEPGYFGVLALGKQSIYGPFRSELELSWTKSSVDRHEDLNVGGLSLSLADAAVLTGAETPTERNVSQVFGDGDGQLSTYSLMVNFYWDIEVPAKDVRPYIGLGGGVTLVNVDYTPSSLTVVSDQDTVLGYQLMFGIAADLNPRTVLHTGFRVRDTAEIDMRTDKNLLSSKLDFDVNQTTIEVGLRRHF